MLDIHCPACEQLWPVELDEKVRVASCPECGHRIHLTPRIPVLPETSAETPLPEVVPPITSIALIDPHRAASVSERTPARTHSRLDQPEPLSCEDECSPRIDAEEQDSPDAPPCSPREPWPRFVPIRYRPDGGLSLSRLPLFLGLLSFSAFFLGWLVSLVGQAYYLVFLFPLGLGMILGGIGYHSSRMAKMRTLPLAGFVGLFIGLLAMLSMHFFDYQRTLRQMDTRPLEVPLVVKERLAEESTFPVYLDAVAEVGLTISGRGEGGFNLGWFGTYAYWTVEGVLVAALAFLGVCLGAREPFCVECGNWKEERTLGTIADEQETFALLNKGNLAALFAAGSGQKQGELLLTASVCSRCGEEAPIDIKVERTTRLGKEEKRIHLTYPGEALGIFEKIFSQANDATMNKLN